MTVEKVTQQFLHMQKVFRMAALLQLTSNYFPKPALVQDEAVYDYIVVGGGTAGCVVASRLLEIRENITVLLIEAGDNPSWEASIPKHFMYIKHTMGDWNATSKQEKAFQHHRSRFAEIPQGKMLGGTSSLNYMIYEQGNPVEYISWASQINNTGWLYDELLPYFQKNEKLIDKLSLESPLNTYGTKGKIKLNKFYVRDIKRYMMAYEEMGINSVMNINSQTPIGVTATLFNCGKKTRQSTAYSFLRHVRNHPKLHVMTNALVSEIIFDAHNNAIGVKVRTHDRKLLSLMANAEIILSAGVFKTPQILMLSGIGPKNHLNSKKINVRVDLPVGQNLRDSPAVFSVFKISQKSKLLPSKTPQWSGFPFISGAVAVHHHDTFPDYLFQNFIFDDPQLFLTLCAIYFTYEDQLCERLFNDLDDKEIFVTLNRLAYPKSSGEVSLGSRNIESQPVIQLGIYNDNQDLVNHASFVAHFHSIVNTSHFERFGAEFVNPKLNNCQELDMGSLSYWQCYAQTMVTSSNNIYGTCAMEAVVDSKFLVKGVNKLRVVDASVIPITMTSPILSTVVMLAEKAVDTIKKDLLEKQRVPDA